jgi:hypothetical protein
LAMSIGVKTTLNGLGSMKMNKLLNAVATKGNDEKLFGN